MRLHVLHIENFRGIKRLDWQVDSLSPADSKPNFILPEPEKKQMHRRRRR